MLDSENAILKRKNCHFRTLVQIAFDSGELDPDSTVAFFATVQQEGDSYVIGAFP